jgi:hypothetical protein
MLVTSGRVALYPSMPDLREQLTPFYGRTCTFEVPETHQQLMRALGLRLDESDAMKLYVFDWKPLDSDVKDEIREAAGQDDFHIFAVINPEVTQGELMTIVRGKHQGFLMYSPDRQNRIYLGDGCMETFTTDIPMLFENLRA